MLSDESRAVRLWAACAGCGCCCDDLELWAQEDRVEQLVGSCPRGDAWFAERTLVCPPVARIDGQEAELSDALDAAADILAAARMPLVYGLGEATCETQRQAVAIAEALGSIIDCAGGVLDGSTAPAFQALGASTATLGEIRDRADVVVVWRSDPVMTHPRLLSRLRLDPLRRAAPRPRALVVVDGERTATGKEADKFISIPAELDLEALWVLRASVRCVPIAHEHTPGLPSRALEQLAMRLRCAQHVAFLYDGGLAAQSGGHVQVYALHALVRDLSQKVHAVSAILRKEGNAAGAEAVLAWQTGYGGAVSFQRGSPRSNADEFSAVALLAGRDVDAALVVGSDPLEHLPPSAAESLRAIPTITVDARDTQTADLARVAFVTAAAGVGRRGIVHRLDDVPIPLRAPLTDSRPGEDEVLRALRVRLSDRLRQHRRRGAKG